MKSNLARLKSDLKLMMPSGRVGNVGRTKESCSGSGNGGAPGNSTPISTTSTASSSNGNCHNKGWVGLLGWGWQVVGCNWVGVMGLGNRKVFFVENVCMPRITIYNSQLIKVINIQPNKIDTQNKYIHVYGH